MRRAFAITSLLLSTFAAFAAPAPTQQPTVPVLMLSDIHFDPFRDVAKFPQLRAAPASEWATILASPADPKAKAPVEPCPSRGLDTDWPLLSSSLQAEHTALPRPNFITLSGDLEGHEFDCRFHALAGENASPAEYSSFAAKTVAFVVLQLKRTFPGVPIYIALGNNDSSCGDYREDSNSAFLQQDATTFAEALPPSARKGVLSSFPALGDSNVALPAPFKNTHLLLLQDLFAAEKYATCANKSEPANAAAQIAWLRTQLTAARAQHQKIWIMAHMPPSVNAYSTITKKADVCSGKKPAMFLATEALSAVIAEYADVVKLTIFGHTHMDEMHVYTAPDGKTGVPSKVVPSISPVNGNNPSFTIASVSPASATILDYTVTTASNLTGVDAKWTEAYRFSKTYNEQDYSFASLAHLTAKLNADRTGESSESSSYQHFYFPGDTGVHAMALRLTWPYNSCSLTADDPADYRACVCSQATAHP